MQHLGHKNCFQYIFHFAPAVAKEHSGSAQDEVDSVNSGKMEIHRNTMFLHKH